VKKYFLILFLIISIHAEDLSLCKQAWSQTESKNFDSALGLFNECIQKGNLTEKSLAQTYRNIGITYSQNGNYQKAINYYDKAIKYNFQDNFPDYANRANALSNLGKYIEAIEDYEKALKINPQYAEIYHNRGLVYYRLGLLKKSSSDYIQAYKLGLRTKNFFNNINNLKIVESYHASVGFVMTLNNLIERTAKSCMPHLNKDDKWMNDLIFSWTNTNKQYVNASKLYLENYFDELSSKNKEASESLQKHILKEVTINSEVSTQAILSKYTSKIKSCKEFEDNVMQGNYDITTKTKMYNELQNLVNIANQ
jgi:tetratricopeptide (TPR) repeat protein